MLRAIVNKSWRQHSTKYQLYGHLPTITKTIQVRRTRHAEHCCRSRGELISDALLWTPHMAEQRQDGELEHTYSSSVRIRDVTLKTCQKRWTIGRNGYRGSRISVLAARHDDGDDDTYKDRLIGLVGRVLANSSGDLGSTPQHLIPKTLKMILDTSLLNTLKYKVRIKVL